MRDAESGGRRVWRRGRVGSGAGGGAGDGVGGGVATSGVGLTDLEGCHVGRARGVRRVRHFLATRLVIIMVGALGGSTAVGAPAIEGIPGTAHTETVSGGRLVAPGEEDAVTSSERIAGVSILGSAADTAVEGPITAGAATTLAHGTTTTFTDGTATTAIRELVALRATSEDVDAAQRYIDALPTEIMEALGYTPVIVDGLPADPEGDCSSPVPLPASFTPACLTHDLGYDLLRIADAAGERIPDDIRLALDEQLGARMAASCGGEFLSRNSCRAVAGIAESAVRVNSWRQHGGAPVAENWPWT